MKPYFFPYLEKMVFTPREVALSLIISLLALALTTGIRYFLKWFKQKRKKRK